VHEQERGNFNESSEKLFMVSELIGRDVSVFYVTVPSAAVSTTLAMLRFVVVVKYTFGPA
jgi:hypothetical protein